MTLYTFSGSGSDEAIEAAAEAIWLASRDDSGYSSEDEPQHDNQCAVAGKPFCSSPSSTVCSDDENSDIESEILFLHEKQLLLKRASSAMRREDDYDASNARAVATEPPPTGSSIWQEARETLEILNRRDAKGGKPSKRSHAGTSRVVETGRNKRSRIDLSSVTCLTSGSFAGNLLSSPSAPKRDVTTRPFVGGGSWVARALTRCMPSSLPGSGRSSGSSYWEVGNDPEVGFLVFPPRESSEKAEIELKEALSFTPVAQVITLSTPPFCVVHANKAFSLFSGLEAGDVIGHSVESLLHVLQDATVAPSQFPHSGYLRAPNGQEVQQPKKYCRMQVSPISERVRNTKGGISHLLVRIKPSDPPMISGAGRDGDVIVKDVRSHSIQQVFGTVG